MWSIEADASTPKPANAYSFVCGISIEGVIALLVFVLFAGQMHLVARAFGGRASFGELSYSLLAIDVPATLIGILLGLFRALPLVGIGIDMLAFIFGIYIMVLQVIAVRGVHRISWGGALMSVAGVPLLLLGGFVACAALGTLISILHVLGDIPS